MSKPISLDQIRALYDRERRIPVLEEPILAAARAALREGGYSMVSGFESFDPTATIKMAIGQAGIYGSSHAENTLIGPHDTLDGRAFGIWHPAEATQAAPLAEAA